MKIEELVETEKILRAMRECEKGVRWKASVQKFEVDSLLDPYNQRLAVR